VPSATHLIAFALVSLGLVLTPGPNMIYLTSRSIVQGRTAGLLSLGGVALGFVSSFAAFLKTRPVWALVQRWLMGTVLAGLTIRMTRENQC